MFPLNETTDKIDNSGSDIGDAYIGFIIQFCEFENLFNQKF